MNIRALYVLFLMLIVASGCVSTHPNLPQHTSYSLYKDYTSGNEEAAALKGRVVNITGKVTKLDMSAARSLYVELDSRIIVFIRKDQVSKLGELGIKEGDSVSAVGTFEGSSVISKWSTGAENDILVLENGEIVGKASWLKSLL